MMQNILWKIAPPGQEAVTLAAELGIPLPIAQVLVNRKVTDPGPARQFLFGSLDDLHDPFMMAGMQAAVTRIRQAIDSEEKILIFGDYDVDGILSVVMLATALRSLGGRADYFIPERLKEGYGIKEDHIRIVLEREAKLVVSVDCGIKSAAFVRRAGECGVDVIITDHHQPGDILPDALAVLNPVLRNSGYPDKNLAGVGVSFKLIQALLGLAGKAALFPHYTKLVAIGTIADVTALRGENRIFVRHGLAGLENVSNLGLRSLIENCGLKGKKVSEGDVGFRIGPRINAAGRMGMADIAVELFFVETAEESLEIVRRLERFNAQRQSTEEKIYGQAVDRIMKKRLHERYKLLVLGCEEWHRGIIGIVASKLKEHFHRPVLLFVYEDGRAYGSGRSISEFPLIDCLRECGEYFLDFGGHRLAVGCVLERDRMDSLKKSLNGVADAWLNEEHLQRKIFVDAGISLTDLTPAFLQNYSLLFPFGVGNPRPLFLTEKVEVTAAPQTLKRKHVKFPVRQEGRTFEALGWNKKDWASAIRKGDALDVVYSLQFSEYMGEEKLSLSLEDFRR